MVTLEDCTRLLELIIQEVSAATGRKPDGSRGWFQNFDLSQAGQRALEQALGKLRSAQLSECHRELTELRNAFFADAHYHLNNLVLPSEFIRLPVNLKTIGISDESLEPVRELIRRFEGEHGVKPITIFNEVSKDYWEIVDRCEGLRTARQEAINAEREAKRAQQAEAIAKAKRERDALCVQTADAWREKLFALELLPA